MKKYICTLLALVMLLLTGCGGQASQPQSTPEADFSFEPLSAEDLTWAAEPFADYDEIQTIPIDAASGGGFGYQLDDSEHLAPDAREIALGVYDLGFSYSFAPEYYEVKTGGNSAVLHMPTLQDSSALPRSVLSVGNQEPTLSLHAEWQEIGICIGHDYSMELRQAAAPWNILFVSGQTTDPGYRIELMYSETNQAAYLIRYDASQGFVTGGEAVPAAGLAFSKPYPALRFDSPARAFMQPQESLLAGATGAVSFDFANLPEDYPGITYSYTDGATGQEKTAVQILSDSALYGYVNPEGEAITDFVYVDAQPFSDGIAACATAPGAYQYIDEDGNAINSETYDSCLPCTCDTIVVKANGQAGLLSRIGRMLISFGAFEDLAPAYADLLWAKQDGKWGLIDLAKAKADVGLAVDLTLEQPRSEILQAAAQQTETDDARDASIPAAYQNIIDLYRQLLQTENPVGEILSMDESMFMLLNHGYLIEVQEGYAYAVTDLNGDGVDELVIGTMADPSGWKPQGLYDIYTMRGDTLIKVADGGARHDFRLKNNGTLLYRGSSGYQDNTTCCWKLIPDSTFVSYAVDGVYQESGQYYLVLPGENGACVSEQEDNGVIYLHFDPRCNLQPISDDQAREPLDQFTARWDDASTDVVIPWIPF